jgi:geranylgeranyl diphosphate synthase type II
VTAGPSGSGGGAVPVSGQGYPEYLRALIEDYLEALDFGAAPPAAPLIEAMRYSLLAGGKRIRPVLALAVAERLGRPPAELLPYAAALELVHTYSLIHDDLPAMDDDVLRRGKPTCHVVFGEDIAILAGDGLFAEAYRLVLERQAGTPEARLAALTEMARAAGVPGMVGGQYIDVAGVAATDESLRLLHELKTGALIEASVVGAAVLCGVEGGDGLQPYRDFARELGLLFQIVDDILDVEGEADDLGKSAGKDALADKTTYVSRFGLEGARALARESHARALTLLVALGGDGSLRAVTDHIFSRRS